MPKMDKVNVRISIVDELGRCIVGTQFIVTVEAYVDSEVNRRYLETKVTSAIQKMIKGDTSGT